MALFGQAHVTIPDYAMLVGYFVLMMAIGAYFYRFMRGMKDYFSGGNSIPWWLSGVSFYMSSFSVAAFIFYPALCYKYGWVGVTLLWVSVPATLFSVLWMAKRWRRARIDSPVEYLEIRYSAFLRQLFAWQGIPVKIVDDGIKLVAIGTFISVGLGVDMKVSMVASGIIILGYTFMGGLWAVAVTDFVQFVVLTVAIVIVLPLSIGKAGGMEAFINNAPDGFFHLTSPEYPWIYVILLALLYTLAWSSINWPLIQRYYCVPTERDAMKVGWLVIALYIVGPPLMFVPAMAAQQFLVGIADKDVYPMLCITLLPAGMLGLVIAAMFAATMSMLSSDYNVCASVLTNDIYRRLIRPDASQRELVLVGRTMTLVVGICALGVALLMMGGTGEDLFRTMVTLFGIATAPVAIPMILGLLSKRVTNGGAIAGFLAGLGVGLLMFFLFSYWLPEDRKTLLLGMTFDPKTDELLIGALRLKMEVVLFMTSALVTLIVTLVVTGLKPMSADARERSDELHRRLATPIGQLPQDQIAAIPGGQMLSPFHVVGISIACIGAMMLAILPWVTDQLAWSLDLGLGILLVVSGVLMAWGSRHPAEGTGTEET